MIAKLKVYLYIKSLWLNIKLFPKVQCIKTLDWNSSSILYLAKYINMHFRETA